MAWLLCDGQAVASIEVAESFGTRLRGLIGRDSIEGALVLTGASSVHTLGMRFPIDVAFCDDTMHVVDIITMRPYRVSLPRVRARTVVEASSGAFERWHLQRGSHLEVRP